MKSQEEMLIDIRQMIVLIAAFTEEHTEGEDLLNHWRAKYLPSQKEKVQKTTK